MRVEDVSDELDKIAKVPGLYDWFSNALASGLACAAFAFANGGDGSSAPLSPLPVLCRPCVARC